MQNTSKRKTQKLRNNLALLYEYSKLYRRGCMTAEKFDEIKHELLEDVSWVEKYKKLKENKHKKFFAQAYSSIFMLKELSLITIEEFNFCNKLLEINR